MSQTKSTSAAPRFQVLEVSIEMVAAVAPVIAAIRRRDRSLADQLRRAVASVPMNIAEGNRRAGRDRLHHFRIAAGSADEVVTGLRVAAALDGPVAGTEEGLRLLDRVLAMLWVLASGR
jgi:four helix bundle protein